MVLIGLREGELMVIAKLIQILCGFVLAMLGIIFAIHSNEHYTLGLLICFGGTVGILRGLSYGNA
mgnify:CR=1 FL=1